MSALVMNNTNSYLDALKSKQIKSHEDAKKYSYVRLISFDKFPKHSALPLSCLANLGFYFDSMTCSILCSTCDYSYNDLTQSHFNVILIDHVMYSQNKCQNAEAQFQLVKEEIEELNKIKKISNDGDFDYEMKNLVNRKNTFKGYVLKLDVDKLVDNGFYVDEKYRITAFFNEIISEKVRHIKIRCVYCNFECIIFEKNDLTSNYESPYNAHYKYSSTCEGFLKIDFKDSNLIIKKPIDISTISGASLSNNKNLTFKTIKYNGDFESLKSVLNRTMNATCDRPYHPAYTTEQARVESFREWPMNLSQQPMDMAKAGFYYYGIKDMVKCFFCNGGLRNWDPIDEPIMEHARWFPKCPYIRQLKGIDFINEIKEKYKDMDSGFTDDSDDTPQYYDTNDGNHEGRNMNANGAKNRSVSPRTLNSRLDLPEIRKIITQLRFKRNTIKQLIEKKLAKDGKDFENNVALIRAYYDNEEYSKNLHKEIKEAFQLYMSNLPTEVNEKKIEEVFIKKFNTRPAAIQRVSDKTSQSSDIFLINLKPQDYRKIDFIENELNGKIFPDSKSGNKIEVKKFNETTENNTKDSINNDFESNTNVKKNKNIDMNSEEDLVEEIERLKREKTCAICLNRDKVIMFLPCAHLSACVECSVSMKQCPICRVEVEGTIRCT